VMSGHTIKHILAAVGSYWILRMLERREPIAEIAAGESTAVKPVCPQR
jgi:hypothetical protein